MDATGLQVLDKDHPAGSRRGNLWADVGYHDTGQPRQAVFDYTPDGRAIGPLGFLADRTGLVQSDGASILDPLFKGTAPPCVNIGCLMHARRYFKQALDAGDMRAAVPLETFLGLYTVEALAAERGAIADERLALRREHSAPLMDHLHR